MNREALPPSDRLRGARVGMGRFRSGGRSRAAVLAALLLATLAPTAAAQGNVTVRNGSGVNPVVLRADPPVPGTSWEAEVITRAWPGVEVTYLEGRLGAEVGIPSAWGEILIDRSGPRLLFSAAENEDGLSKHRNRIPADPRLPGFPFSVQGLVGSAEGLLTNALDVNIARMEAPSAEFAPFPMHGITPHTVRFEDLTAGTVADWLWDFGDGRTSTDPTPNHTYTVPGNYTVTLTVNGPAGMDVRTRTNVITVFDPFTSAVQPGVNLEVSRLESLNPEDSPTADVFDLSFQLLGQYADPIPGWAYAELAKPIDMGHVLAMIYDRQTVGPTVQKQLVEVNAAGQIVWQFDPRPHRVHHDFERLANGNTLVITQRAEEWPAINTSTIWNDYILEADGSGATVWSWDMASHWNELPFSAEERAYLAAFPGGTPAAIFHTNSLATLPPNPHEATDPRFAQGNLIVSLRETNKVFIIDRTTGSVVWSYGGAIAQHHVRMIPPGLLGAGNIMIFDNGGTSGAPPVTRNWSRVIELDPTTMREAWVYEDRGGFFTNVMGASQRLPNGNTLVTDSINARVIEVDTVGNILWSYLRPTLLPVYRTYRVDASWLSSSISFPW